MKVLKWGEKGQYSQEIIIIFVSVHISMLVSTLPVCRSCVFVCVHSYAPIIVLAKYSLCKISFNHHNLMCVVLLLLLPPFHK